MRSLLGILLACAFACGAAAQSVNFSSGVSQATFDAAMANVQGQVTPLQTWAQSMTVKAASIPASGPGAGICLETIVPSNLVTSGGVTGSAGTCAMVVQCGTSATYIVKQMNIGSGC